MELKKYIEIGEVIRIISESSLIVSLLNLDTSAIPKEGDKVEIYSLGDPLFDSHGDKIADFVQVKDNLKIKKVENKYLICQKESVNASALFEATKSLADMFDTVQESDINVDSREISPLGNYSKKIRIGDLARLKVADPKVVTE
ncbi:hypothetical protein [Dubosiella newyorkensis]|uniref:hypothetical protein n=1 Tax=Dubosiella newyorkensis TaxID=1862672 RepID=UPI00272B0969|nr:hypothetical protein [Dubosiella newyorkensis]